MSVSVLIRTLNEENNLPTLLENVSWCDDIVLVDSGSTDRTIEIAKEAGLRIYTRGWGVNESEHFHWMLDNIRYKHEWILLIDADERLNDELLAEIKEIAQTSSDEDPVAYYCKRKNILFGKWLRHSMPPTPVMRLFRKDKIRFERTINTTPIVDGKHGYLKSLLTHYNFSKGITEWLDRHNRYSTFEAIETVRDRSINSIHWQYLFSLDRVTRTHETKKLSFRLPFRATCKFIYMYFLRGGFLDGRAGLIYCILQYLYEWMIVVKISSLKYRGNEFEGIEINTTPLNGHNQNSESHSLPDVGCKNERVNAEMKNRMRSPWTFKEKVMRVIWGTVESTIFRYSFHNMYRWRNFLLRLFGAKIGRHCTIRRTASVYIPWHLEMGDWCTIGDNVIIYPLGPIKIGDRVMVSQLAHLCAGTHDFTQMDMPLLRPPIEIGDDVWICTDVFVGPNVKIGEGCVVGARSSVYSDMPNWKVCVGNPAKVVREREINRLKVKIDMA